MYSQNILIVFFFCFISVEVESLEDIWYNFHVLINSWVYWLISHRSILRNQEPQWTHLPFSCVWSLGLGVSERSNTAPLKWSSSGAVVKRDEGGSRKGALEGMRKIEGLIFCPQRNNNPCAVHIVLSLDLAQGLKPLHLDLRLNS